MNNKSKNAVFVQHGSVKSQLSSNTTKHIMDNDGGKNKKQRRALKNLKNRSKRK